MAYRSRIGTGFDLWRGPTMVRRAGAAGGTLR